MGIVYVMLSQSPREDRPYLLKRTRHLTDRHESFLKLVAPNRARFTADKKKAITFKSPDEAVRLVREFPILNWDDGLGDSEN